MFVWFFFYCNMSHMLYWLGSLKNPMQWTNRSINTLKDGSWIGLSVVLLTSAHKSTIPWNKIKAWGCHRPKARLVLSLQKHCVRFWASTDDKMIGSYLCHSTQAPPYIHLWKCCKKKSPSNLQSTSEIDSTFLKKCFKAPECNLQLWIRSDWTEALWNQSTASKRCMALLHSIRPKLILLFRIIWELFTHPIQ